MKKIKFILTCLFILGHFMAISQNRYMTRTGHISFFSKAPLENIEAHNRQVNSIFDLESGEFAFSVLMRGFEFEKALMQEHFNENFVESHIYPRATFRGSIIDFDGANFTDGTSQKVRVQGDLTIHGVTHQITAEGNLQRKGNNIVAQSNFPIRVEDYDIRIPRVVRRNIAEVVDVRVEVVLEPFENQAP